MTDTDLINSLKLMLFGMVGILIVMIFIWIVIAVLNRLPSKDNKQGLITKKASNATENRGETLMAEQKKMVEAITPWRRTSPSGTPIL